jgi:hypothetical protein
MSHVQQDAMLAGIDAGRKMKKNNDVKKAKSVTCTCTAFNFYEVELTIVPTGKSGTELITTLRGCSSPSTTRTVAS